MENKKEIRSRYLEIRNGISSEERAQKSHDIIAKLEELDEFQDAEHILFYYSHGSEVDVIPLINKWTRDKKIYLPKLITKDEFAAMPFSEYDTLTLNKYKIPEPNSKPDEMGSENKLDLVLVPGVAFDKDGNRLGTGKGFYDRYLKKLKPIPRIGLAFEAQMLDQLPKDDYDENVHLVITESKIYRANDK